MTLNKEGLPPLIMICILLLLVGVTTFKIGALGEFYDKSSIYDEAINQNEIALKQYRELKEDYDELLETYTQHDALTKVLATRNMRDYDKETNNCYQQAQWLQKEFLKVGIESSIMINQDRSHAWIAPWIEPTNGSYKVWGDQNIGEVKDNTYQVVCN